MSKAIKTKTFQWIFFLAMVFMVPLFNFFGILCIDTKPFLRIVLILTSSFVWVFIFDGKEWRRDQGFGKLFMIMGLQTLFLYIFQQIQFINDYPLSQSWSETSHYYYASTFFAERVYGKSLMLPYIKQSMYLVLSVPFFIPDVSLFSLRLWERFLVIITPVLTSYLLIRRVSFSKRIDKYNLFIWCTLFIIQGPIYYHLLLVPIVFFIFYQSSNVIKTTVLIIFLSIWTGLSRINWYAVPGTLAALMYYLEVELNEDSWVSVVKYNFLPGFWVVLSTGTSFLTEYVYQEMTTIDPKLLSSAFYSKLLWYRLLPNPTYTMGILLGTIVVSGVVSFFILERFKELDWSVYRIIAILGIVAVYLVGGLIVSVKIGGGADLHNMDVFLLLIAWIFLFLYFRKKTLRKRVGFSLRSKYKYLLLLLFLIPVIYVSSNVSPAPDLNYRIAAETIETLQERVNFYNAQGEDVLLATQHHLFTFDLLSGVVNDPYYEKTLMMEVAISENVSIIKKYRRELENEKYPVIIIDFQNTRHKNREESSFAEEQYFYAEYVADTIHKNYIKKMSFPEGINIFLRR